MKTKDDGTVMGEGLKAMVGDGTHLCVCGKRLLLPKPYYLAMVRCPFEDCMTVHFIDVVDGKYAMRPMTELALDRVGVRWNREVDGIEDYPEREGSWVN